ncbi:uncharacterized protein LOC143121186 [Alosa pseudoharengus]|uniref:uncharacterized protein LOC143121186 n=1 Tax=Alosa pseudoharengus TaxID=34774 RepID=UPI003F8BA8E6
MYRSIGMGPQPRMHYCGHKKYHPIKQICCHGRRHIRVPEMSCCGTEMYNPWSDEPCSGRFKSSKGIFLDGTTAKNKGKEREVEGTFFPLASDHRLNCDSGGRQLRRLAQWKRQEICCSQVFLGWVESMAQAQKLTMVMTAILRINGTQVTPEAQPQRLHISLNCVRPHTPHGVAYLWTGANCPTLLISDISELTAPVHALLSRRQKLKCDVYEN